MANHTTGAQRYNKKKDEIFAFAKAHAEKTGRKSTWDGVDMRSDAMKKNMAKDGFDGHKRWGNSAVKGHGVNSPAMMEERKKNMAKKMNHTPKKAPSWSALMKKNPNLHRDSKGNVGYKNK